MSDWDDGKHKKVKKVKITYGDDFVNSIQVDYYDDDGKTVEGLWHGGISGKYSAEFTLQPDDYIVDFVCYHIDGYISALVFRMLDDRNFGPYGRTSGSRRDLVIFAPEGNEVVGLRGKIHNDKLLELDAYVGPVNLSIDNKLKAAAKWLWDDGAHDNVKKIHLTYDDDVIKSIQVDYHDGYETFKGQLHGSVGSKSDEFELHADEYLTQWKIYYYNGCACGMSFRSNQRNLGLYGKETTSLADIRLSEGNLIAGFRGRGSDRLSDITAFAGPIKLSDSGGGKRGQEWDDGANHDGVRTIFVGVGRKGIHCIKFNYDKYGILHAAPIRGLPFEAFSPEPFEINHPNEYIVSVVGYYDVAAIQGLQFITNKRESKFFGYGDGTKFTLKVKDKKIVGFHGFADSTLNFLGAYFVPVSSSSSASSNKVEVQGGKGGKEWDDGADHSGVTKIAVGVGRRGVHYIKFDYDKSGQLKDGPIHGITNGTMSQPHTFDIDHPNEYLVSVVGYYEGDNIQGLRFKTNKRESQGIGYVDEGTKFTIEVKSKKIVGFHGCADSSLNSLGAYFVPIPSTSSSSTNKLEVQGGKGGKEWDDVTDHNGIRKIVVGVGRKGVHYIKFDYFKSGQLQDGQVWGLTNGTFSPPPTFEMDHPNYEYLVAVIGFYDNDIIQGLQFKTNKRESQIFGYYSGTKFTLEVKDKKIVGFHGYAETYLNSLGAYFAPISSSPLSSINKLEAKGGKGETTFDDGTFDGVSKVYVGQGDSSVTYVKFEYNKGGNVETREHGKRGMLGTDEFELEKDEYITSLEGYYEKIYDYKEAVISALIFKTSKGRTSPQFGVSGGEKFELDGKGGKLVGFHGSAGEVLHSLGAYFAPSSTSLTPPNK